MLIAYLCGALATAMAAMGGAIRFSGPRTGLFTQLGVAVLAGVFWPVVAIGALQAMGIALLANWMRPTPTAADADADADASTLELLLTG